MLKKLGHILNKDRRYTKMSYKSSGNSSLSFINLLTQWDKVVGPKLAEVTLPQKLQYQTLRIVVNHPLYAEHLKLISSTLISKIETDFPSYKGEIKELKFLFSEKAFQEVQEKLQIQKNHSEYKEFTYNKHDPLIQQKILEAEQLFKDLDEESRKSFISLYIQSQTSKK